MKNEAIETTEQRKYFIEEADFPVGLFPKAIESYLRKKAKILQIDYATLALICLGLCSVAMGGKKKVKLGDWVEKGILWLVMVGRSGIGKTSILENAGLAQVEAWQGEQIQQFREAQEAYEEQLHTWENLDREERKERFANGKPIEPKPAPPMLHQPDDHRIHPRLERPQPRRGFLRGR